MLTAEQIIKAARLRRQVSEGKHPAITAAALPVRRPRKKPRAALFGPARAWVHRCVQVFGGGEYWPDHEIFGHLVEEVGELARSRRPKGRPASDPTRQLEEAAEVCDCLFSLLAYANARGIDLDEAFRKKYPMGTPRGHGRRHT